MGCDGMGWDEMRDRMEDGWCKSENAVRHEAKVRY